MARIPLGNFDQPRVTPQPQRSGVDLSGTLQAGRAIEAAGQTLAAVGERGLALEEHRIRQEAAEQEREAADLRRVRMANAAADFELEVDAARQTYETRMRAGQVDFQSAVPGWDEVLGKIETPQVPSGIEPAQAEQFTGTIGRIRQASRQKIAGVMGEARMAESERQAEAAFERIEQLAAVPGRSAEVAIESNHALLPLLRAAGKDEAAAAERIRKADAQVWSNEVQGRINAGEGSADALDAIHRDLSSEDGRYVDKLDPSKRLTLAASVLGKIEALRQRQEVAAERLTAVQDQTLAAIDEQIASAVPATTEQWASWAEVFKDSPRAVELEQRMQEELSVQSLLRKPVAEQQAALQEALATLQTSGGDKRAISLYNKLESAVGANLKQLQDQPLLWAQARLGVDVEPLDIDGAVVAASADPSQAPAPIRLGAQLRQRLTLNDTIRKKMGPQVAMQPLLPQERALLAGVLDKLPAPQTARMFGLLRQSIGSDQLYRTVMQSIAPDSPVRALAGQVYLDQRRTAANAKGALGGEYGDVALLMLQGEELLHPSKQSRAQDGKREAYPLPTANEFHDRIARRFGTAFAGRPEDLNTAVQGVRAYYAAKAANDGDITAVMDVRRLRTAINAVVGERVEIEGHDVIPPWGMEGDTFRDLADVYIQARLKAAGVEDPGDVGLLNVAGRPGAYLLVRGIESLSDRNGVPLVIRIGGRR